MDLYIDRDDFARGLARVQSVVERRSTQPILSNVLLVARPDGLRMTATDTEVAYIGELAANVQQPGELAVDANNLFQVIRTLPDKTVRLTIGSGNRLDIRCGRSFFRVPGLPADEYPSLPPFEQRGAIRVGERELRRLVDQTSFSVATDDSRYGLNGVHLEAQSGDAPALRFVATDGHRLSAAESKYTGELALSPRTLVPRKALSVLRKLLDGPNDDVELVFGDKAMRMTRSGETFWFRLLDGEFPDYRAVVPTAGKHQVVLQRNDLSATLKRVSLLVFERTRAVKFAFGTEELTIEIANADRGEVKEALPIELQGDAITVGFNVRYLQDVLGVLSGDRVHLEMAHPLGPCLVRDPDADGAFFVVMPMRLD